MTFFGASDLPAMLADFGVPVVWGLVQDLGIADIADEEMFGAAEGSFTGTERSVVVRATTFAGLAERDTITVDGESFYVIAIRQEGDGALSRILCRPS